MMEISLGPDAVISTEEPEAIVVEEPDDMTSVSAASMLTLPDTASICTEFSAVAMETPVAAEITVLRPELT